MKVEKICEQCGEQIFMYPSRAKRAEIFFCNKSCHRKYKNLKDNPSLHRDISGSNNPMWGKHPTAWNKGLKGEQSHNWKGGLHKRKDGYFRINVNGKRHLYHRYLLKDKIVPTNVIHHIDNDPSNNSLKNLQILSGHSEHALLHVKLRNNGKR